MPETTITIIATVPLTYQGRRLSAGESFQARPVDAAALHYQRKASFTRPRRVRTRDMVADPAVPESDTDETPRRRRAYRRRDMVPEP